MQSVEPTSRLCAACNYPLVHDFEGACPECGRAFDWSDPRTLNPTGKPIGPWSRWVLAIPAWPWLAFAALVTVGWGWAMRNPDAAFHSRPLHSWFVPGFLLLWFRLFQWLSLIRLSGRFDHQPFLRSLRSRWPVWPVLVLLTGFIWLADKQQWPMRCAFWMSEGALNRLADGAVANPAAAGTLVPTMAGLYAIESIEVQRMNTVFLRTPNELLSMNWGFLRTSLRRNNDSFNVSAFGSSYPLGYKQRLRHLKGDWYVVYDSY